MISSNLQERRNGRENCGRYKCFDFRRVLWRVSQVKLCRDSDDDKFLECAKDSHALYIVSGDKDLLVIGNYENIQIVTAKDFCEEYLTD